jgi:hypothetical protein
MFWSLGALLAAGAGLFLLLHTLFQPSVNPNPGPTAYVPPPGTRLVPLPRKSDAPQLADVAADPLAASAALPAPASPLTALAKSETSDQQGKREIRPTVHKRPHADYTEREHEQRRYGFIQPWNYGSPANYGSPGWNSPHVMTGGPKSWF